MDNQTNEFKNRVFGAVLIKAIGANYNADFTGSPRTLPNGVVYATDKALKYCIRNYLKSDNENIIFYTTRYKKESMQPLDMDETYIELFGEYPKVVKDFNKKDKKGMTSIEKEIEKYEGYVIDKETDELIILSKKGSKNIILISDNNKRKYILQNILNSIDIRLFGATFASKEGNMSIHGNIQITHGINIYNENSIFTEDITSPFRNSNDKSEGNHQTTIGNQTILEEGHYLHNFTINPKNTEEITKLIDNQGYLTNDDIDKFKEGINRGVTYLDSASKIGVENEFSIFITLNENEKIQLPSFNTLIKIEKIQDSKRKIYLSKLKKLISDIKDKIEKVEIYINEYSLEYDNDIFNIDKICVKSIISDKELKE